MLALHVHQDDPLTPGPCAGWTVTPPTVMMSAWRDPSVTSTPSTQNATIVVVASTAREPVQIELSRGPCASSRASAEVLFQSRNLTFSSGGTARDVLLGYGTAAYRVTCGPDAAADAGTAGNLVLNSGFELAGNAGSADGMQVLYPCIDNNPLHTE